MNFSEDYLSILRSDLKGLNLTRITELSEFHEKQFIDSIKPFLLSSNLCLEGTVLVDVGFGGGFPSLPIISNFNKNSFEVLGIEARAKKVKAVNFISEKMNLNKFKAVHLRLESLMFDRECLITFKAVGKISEFLSKIQYSTSNIKVLFYKGPGLSDQESGYRNIFGWELIEENDYLIGENTRKYLIYKPVIEQENTNKDLVNLTSILSNK